MERKYPPHDFLLAVIILRHNQAGEYVTFRSLLDELFPVSGKEIQRNIEQLTDIGMIYWDPVKLPPRNDWVFTYHVSDHDISLVETLDKRLRELFPNEYPYFDLRNP